MSGQIPHRKQQNQELRERLVTLERACEDARREGEERAKSLFNAFPDAAIVYDPASQRFLDINEAAESLYGFNREEFLALRLSELSAELEKTEDAVRRTMSGSRLYIPVRYHKKKDGTVFPVEISVDQINFGGMPAVLGVTRDITERKRMESRIAGLSDLKEQLLRPGNLQEKLQRITEAVVSIFAADFARIWVTKPGDLCDSGCLHATLNEGPHVCRQKERCLRLVASAGRYTHTDGETHRRVPFGCYKIGRVASGKEPGFLTNDVTNDPRIHDHDWARELALVSCAGYRILSPAGEPTGVLALFSQHALSPQEHSLLESVANTAAQVIQVADAEEGLLLFRDLMDQSLDILAIIDPLSGRVLDANRRMFEMLGYSRAELLAMRVIDFDTMGSSEAWAAVCGQQRGRDSAALESVYKRKDQTTLPVSINVRYTVHGEKEYLVVTSRDISERKRAEEEKQVLDEKLQHIQKLESLAVLAGGIAHDFNNLLMGVLGNAELALTTLPPVSPTRGNIEGIVTAAECMTELATQMLAYSGRGAFEVEPIDLSGLVEGMASLLESSISKYAVLTLDLARDLPAVSADAAQMSQVIMNLIINGSEAIGSEAGRVCVTTRIKQCDRSFLESTYIDDQLPEGAYVCLEVADTGCGMDSETRARVFEPFFTTKFTGRGLGLASLLGIVRGHKGAIIVDSEAERGTTFTVALPAIKAPVPSVSGDDPAEKTRACGTLLLVDDEEIVRSVAGKILEELGFEVLMASDGYEAVEVFKEHQDEIALVLLDVNMPRMNGIKAFSEIRSIRGDVRVILSSGYTEEQATATFAGQGLGGFIQKPYRIKELQDKLSEALGPGLAESKIAQALYRLP